MRLFSLCLCPVLATELKMCFYEEHRRFQMQPLGEEGRSPDNLWVYIHVLPLVLKKI